MLNRLTDIVEILCSAMANLGLRICVRWFLMNVVWLLGEAALYAYLRTDSGWWLVM